MTPELIKGVVWPRGEVKRANAPDGPAMYKYAIIGVILTAEPIPEFESGADVVLRGVTVGLGQILAGVPQVKPAIRIGDANQVLTQLDYITGDK
jgi:hypothetical protein